MGSGISVLPQGKHIAYTAGTGVLVFMDLVAYLLLKVVELNGGPSIISNDNLFSERSSSGLAITKSETGESSP